MAELLMRLRTDLGDRSTYDAASQCNRCGYCGQVCPTYVVTGSEPLSGRGRNQLVRLLLEGKFRDPGSVRRALETCLLCGACTSACYARVPTADIVLEGRRMLRRSRGSGLLMRILGWLLERWPGVLASLLKSGNLMKRLGVARRLFVEEAPLAFLNERLREDPELCVARGATWAYFAPCGPNYIYPRVGLATVSALKRVCGRGVFLDNPCCGLPFYNYGDLGAARRMARRNIELWEARSRDAGRDLPYYGDCSACVAHLKGYPQIFLEEKEWRERSKRFSKHVKDIIEIDTARIPLHARHPVGEARVTLHDSCRARHGQGLAEQPRGLMRTLFGDSYVELPEAGWCCGGAGAYAFAQPGLSEEVLKRTVSRIAATQARLVATSGTSCLVQIARGLKKYYPECRVVHVSEVLAERLSAWKSAGGRL